MSHAGNTHSPAAGLWPDGGVPTARRRRYNMSEARTRHGNEREAVTRDLTAFQRNILAILADEPMYGLAIKRELESYYGADVNHGRLYPNLDDLVELGLVEKSELDKRTNQYALTDTGRETVIDQLAWLLEKYVTDAGRRREVEQLFDTIA
jgi:DNA-binding PadR family transcriptional regulator